MLDNRRVTVTFGRFPKQFDIIEMPVPHIIVNSKKEIHGWWEGIEPYGNRECTAERLLINPYNGCTHNCLFCYAHALWGYFKLFREKHIVTVFRDFDRSVSKQLDNINIASCGYLSPVTDPFQPINEKYRLTEKIIKEFVNRNIPVEFITKGKISETAIKLIKKQEHSFGQVSILTSDEEKRKKLMSGGVSVDELIRNIKRLANEDIFAVCRIDPIIPFLTDKSEDLEELVRKVVEAGAKHIITSCMDIPGSLESEILREFEEKFKIQKKEMKNLYSERIRGDLNANIRYRRRLFKKMQEICNRHKVSMGLCMEFESLGGKRVRGMNAEFMTSQNCEGINIPIYIRKDGEKFEPIEGCNGDCLSCHFSKQEQVCEIPKLKKGGAWKLKDYKKWGKYISTSRQVKLEEESK